MNCLTFAADILADYDDRSDMAKINALMFFAITTARNTCELSSDEIHEMVSDYIEAWISVEKEQEVGCE